MPRVATSKATVALLIVLGCAALSAPAASAELTTVGLGGWQVQSSARASQPGTQISEPGF